MGFAIKDTILGGQLSCSTASSWALESVQSDTGWATFTLPRQVQVVRADAVLIYYFLTAICFSMYIYSFIVIQPQYAYTAPYGGYVTTEVDLDQSLATLSATPPPYCSATSTTSSQPASPLPCLYFSPTQMIARANGGFSSSTSSGSRSSSLFLTTRLSITTEPSPPPGCDITLPTSPFCRESETTPPSSLPNTTHYYIADVGSVILSMDHVILLNANSPISAAQMGGGRGLVLPNGTSVQGNAFSVSTLLSSVGIPSLDTSSDTDSMRFSGLSITVAVNYGGWNIQSDPGRISYAYLSTLPVNMTQPRVRELIPVVVGGRTTYQVQTRAGIYIQFIQTGTFGNPNPMGVLVHLLIFMIIQGVIGWLVMGLLMWILPGRTHVRRAVYVEDSMDQNLPPRVVSDQGVELKVDSRYSLEEKEFQARLEKTPGVVNSPSFLPGEPDSKMVSTYPRPHSDHRSTSIQYDATEDLYIGTKISSRPPLPVPITIGYD